jgi:tRNA(Ile)-lysidine synthase
MSIDYCAVSDADFTSDEKRQYLDSAQLVFPLVIRSRRDGDRFHPLGASGYQKVSDFMVHSKIAAWRKEEVLLLQSKEEIVAVLQYRISEKFKKTETTEQCVRIQFF